jgi:hypothetical protein
MKGLASRDLTDRAGPPLQSRREPISVDFSALDRTFEDGASGAGEPAPVPPIIGTIASVAPPPPAVEAVSAASAPQAASPAKPARAISRTTVAIYGLLAIITVEAFVIGALARRVRAMPAGRAEAGTLTVLTNQPDARVIVDGTDRGAGSVTLSLAPGVHHLAVENGASRRETQIEIAGGSTVAHHVELAAAAPAARAGTVEVRSRPAGASVVMAGRVRGRTPLVVADLPPGAHEVHLTLGTQQIKESVTVTSDRVALLSATFPAAPSGTGSGWLVINSPIELTVLEEGRVVGTSRSDRIMMPAGRHALELANERLAYRTSRAVDIGEGRTATIAVEPPRGAISVNALPWAELWIGDRKVGDTPLGNVVLPLGTHELVFRHPSFRERREQVTVTAGAPVRVSVDMRR